MQKNILGLKKLKVKIIKKRGKKWKKKEKRGKKGKHTELQKPNIEAEVYSNNRKCD